MALSYYHDFGVRGICHAVKRNDITAIDVIVDYLTSTEMVDEKSILIPAPQHYGFADYTKRICERIATITQSQVADILKCYPHESLYKQKLSGGKAHAQFYLDGKIPEGRLFFVDNVISTGFSFHEARKLIGLNLKPFVYAIDETRYEEA